MLYSTPLRNAFLSAINTQVAAGTTNSTPRILLKSASNAVLGTLNMSVTPFGTPSNGSMTANAISPDTNSAAGTLASYDLVNRDNVVILSGTITEPGGGGDATTSNLVITAGSTLTIGTFTLTAPTGN
jgi:hypothetical protein